MGKRASLNAREVNCGAALREVRLPGEISVAEGGLVERGFPRLEGTSSLRPRKDPLEGFLLSGLYLYGPLLPVRGPVHLGNL